MYSFLRWLGYSFTCFETKWTPLNTDSKGKDIVTAQCSATIVLEIVLHIHITSGEDINTRNIKTKCLEHYFGLNMERRKSEESEWKQLDEKGPRKFELRVSLRLSEKHELQ